ncbi:FecR family protein [Flectobacillus roseus]
MAEHQNIDELLAKYLAEESPEEDFPEIQDHLNELPDGDTVFEHSKIIWDASAAFQQKKSCDVNAAWQKVKKQMSCPAKLENQTPIVHLNESSTIIRPLSEKRVIPFKRVVGIAASVIVLIGVLLFVFWKPTSESAPLQESVAQEKVLNYTLPDGTKVTLNRGSKISYPSTFEGQTREITLQGEAFFDVAHDAQHPFIIHAQGAAIKVLGTSFNVNAYSKQVKVWVKTGKVQVKKSSSVIQLLPGEQAEVQGDEVVRSTYVDANQAAYFSQSFNFENTDLSSVVTTLSQVYGVKVTLANEAMSHCKLTVNFEKESLENILAVIATTFDINVQKQGQNFVLEGKGCQ